MDVASAIEDNAVDTYCSGFLLSFLSRFLVDLQAQLRKKFITPIVLIVFEKIKWLVAGITQVSLDVLE